MFFSNGGVLIVIDDDTNEFVIKGTTVSFKCDPNLTYRIVVIY